MQESFDRQITTAMDLTQRIVIPKIISPVAAAIQAEMAGADLALQPLNLAPTLAEWRC